MIPSYVLVIISVVSNILFFTVFPNYHKGDNNLQKYFAKLYVAVFRFQMIGRIGRSLIPAFIESMCILEVP